MTKKPFILFLVMMFALAAHAQLHWPSVTQTSDSTLAAQVNAAYASDCHWQRVTFAQKSVDYLRTLSMDIPAYGREPDGDYRRGVFLVEAAIHTVVDSAGLKAAYEECISRVGGIRLAMPEEGEWVVVGCTDRSRLGERSAADVSEVFANGQFVFAEESGCFRTLSPLYAFDHSRLGVVELKFRRGVPADRVAEAAANYVRILSQCTLDYGELMSPFDEGFRPGDMLCQKINQMVLARHPELLIYSLHIVDPADSKRENRHYAINRPNFHKESGPLTLDTEVTGKVYVVMLPYSHHMEMHLPLIDKRGRFVGVIVCGYLYDSLKEGVDCFARSFSLMDETTRLMPDTFADLFKP